MAVNKYVQNICKEGKDGLTYVVVPKIINTDVSFQLMFGKNQEGDRLKKLEKNLYR